MIEKIQEVLQNFISAQMSFSAHDVTTELRSQGEHVYHGQIKQDIHDEMSKLMSNYQKTFEKTPYGSVYQLYSPILKSVSNSVVLNSVQDFDGRDLNFEQDSSWIESAKWNVDSKELLVETKYNSYVYENVDSKSVLEWEVSDSVGSYFNENIKNEFACVKLH